MKLKKGQFTIWICNRCNEEYPYEPVYCNDCGTEFVANKTFTDVSSQRSDCELALEWWRNLDHNTQEYFKKKYNKKVFGGYSDQVVLNEIEEIWKRELQDLKKSTIEGLDKVLELISNIDKPNQKQFKEFNSELFKSYISKFSDEDKLRAFEILFNSCKKWDGINNAAPFYMSICRAYNAGKQNMIDVHNNPSPGNESINPKFVSSDRYFKQEFGFE